MSDLTLATALIDAEQKARRLPHGRVTLVIERFDKRCVDWSVEVDPWTREDYRRVMEERPNRRR